MRAITYSRYGDASVLELTELPTPKVGPDSVLVRVRAASVNPVDWKMRAGYLDGLMDVDFPVVPGWDVAGVVERVGLDTPEFQVGDEVYGYVRRDWVQGGTFAELVAAPVRTLSAQAGHAVLRGGGGGAARRSDGLPGGPALRGPVRADRAGAGRGRRGGRLRRPDRPVARSAGHRHRV